MQQKKQRIKNSLKKRNKMSTILGFILLLLSLYFFKLGFNFKDKNEAKIGYLINIRFIGTGVLLLIGALALFFKSSL